jgi:Bacterial Ig-like domain (group 3)
MSWFTCGFGKRSGAAKKPRRPAAARPQLEALEDRQVPAVLNFGGSLLPHVEAQALFLGNEWSSVPADAAQTTTLNAFLKDLTGGAYMDALTRAGYGVGRGSAAAGAVDNAALTAGSTITDGAIRAEIQADVNDSVLQAPDANRLYVVYVEPNVAVNLGAGQGTTQQGILGYHAAFAGHDAAGNPTVLHYAVVAYPGGSVGNSTLPGRAALDQLTAVSSHEVAEAATDPNVNFGRLGWFDPRRGEIGDITENNPNAFVRLDGFLVQEVADRNDQLLPILNASSLTATAATLRGTVNPNTFVPTVTFTVTITPASGQVAPDGTITVLVGNAVLGAARVQVVNGVATATFTVAFFAPGDFTFTAVYSGSSQFLGSFSNTVTVHVT